MEFIHVNMEILGIRYYVCYQSWGEYIVKLFEAN